ncbi:MBL fold metallo-hydrolase [Microbacterium sp.]|uniref:MBL fold metallo-hydrolase n=1 Tax=Microbacterium sp. TaxID=51671 RepID=UPI0039E2AEBE
MRITKYEHACLSLEEGGARLIVDPGNFTAPLEDLAGIAAVMLTHEHPDHWTAAQLQRILEHNPGIPIFGPAGVAAAAKDFAITAVAPGDTVAAGPFTLRFFGGVHAVIHSSIPLIDNVGVLVNDAFYYPGDSYAVPESVDVQLLAAPIGAPWLKIGEAMDFVLAVAPRRAFGTHDASLSTRGLAMHRQRLQWATERGGGTFEALDAGDTTTL